MDSLSQQRVLGTDHHEREGDDATEEVEAEEAEGDKEESEGEAAEQKEHDVPKDTVEGDGDEDDGDDEDEDVVGQQDEGEGATKQVDADDEQNADEGAQERPGGNAVEDAQRDRGKETATPEDGAEAVGSPPPELACSSGATAAECDAAVAAAQEVHDTTAKSTRLLRQQPSHPDAPSKKSQKAEGTGSTVTVASPTQPPLGDLTGHFDVNAMPSKARDARSRSPRAGTVLGRAEMKQDEKAQQAKLRQTAVLDKAERATTSPTEGQTKPSRSHSVPVPKTRSERRDEAQLEWILEERLNTKKKMMHDYAFQEDFDKAAAAKEDVELLEDFTGQLCAKHKEMNKLVEQEDYEQADAVQREIKAMEQEIRKVVASKNDLADAAAAQAVGHEWKAYQEQLAAKKKSMRELADKRDFVGAAQAKAEVAELEKNAPKHDFVNAAAPQAVAQEMQTPEKQPDPKKKKAKNVVGAATAQAEPSKVPSKHACRGAADDQADRNEPRASNANKDSTGETVEREPGVLLEEQLKAKIEMMKKLATNREYARAQAVKEDVIELQAFADKLRALKAEVKELVERGDLLGAHDAKLKEKATEELIMGKVATKNNFAEAAPDQAVAQEMKRQEEQLAAKKKTMKELAANGDFLAAATAQTEAAELAKCLSELAVRAEAIEHAEKQIRECESKGDSQAAASWREVAQKERDAAIKSRSAPATVMPPRPGKASGKQRDPRSGRTAQRSAGSGQDLVNLEKLRVLSSSKLTQVPKMKGKGSGKKGAGRKGGGRGGMEAAWEDFVALYLGQVHTKKIYHVLAYGDCVKKLHAYVELDYQPFVNVQNLERRPGKEELYCTSTTVISTCVEPTGGHDTALFVYDVEEVTKHLATKTFGTQMDLGHYVDLVLRVDSAIELEIQSGEKQGEPYLQLSGVDMDGMNVGTLRLWNHMGGDAEVGKYYILRGLKVAPERQWNGERYVPDREGAKKLESDARTAIEDVSEQTEITYYFS